MRIQALFLLAYNEAMDKVRFGRALGYGARHAAKSLLAAADAAAAPSPERSGSTSKSAVDTNSTKVSAEVRSRSSEGASLAPPLTAQRVLRGLDQARAVQVEAGKQARRSFFAPVAKFSSVVSLQVSGTFFALLAFVIGQAVWRNRAALHMGWAAAEARRSYLTAAVALMFSYFAVSNFLRARRRDRG